MRKPFRTQSPFVKRVSTPRFQFLSALLLVLIAGLLIGVSALLHHPRMQIEAVVVEGTKSVDPARLVTAAHSALRGDYLGLFPRGNTMLVSEENLRDRVQDVSTRIATVEISKDSSQELVVHVTERQPIALWCGVMPEDNDRKDCSYVDDIGVIFDDAPEFSSHVFMKVFGVLEKKDGSNMLPVERFIFLQSLFGVLRDERFTVKEAWIKEGEDVVLLIEDSSRSDWTLQVRNHYTAEQVMEDLLVVLAEIEKNEPHAMIEYIDMRFGNKVYYKTEN